MDLLQAINERHSVRAYQKREIDTKTKEELLAFIHECNRESGLNIQLVSNEPEAFKSFLAHYGKFKGVENYLALVGKKSSNLDELCGYFGEKIVLKAQQLGLNTCWVALTYKKIEGAFKVKEDEKLCCIISLGYGLNPGVKHKSKTIEKVIETDGNIPDWFKAGVEAALLAPTAMNQQKFKFSLNGNRVKLKAGRGFNAKIDLGIVKYHFEIGAKNNNFVWH